MADSEKISAPFWPSSRRKIFCRKSPVCRIKLKREISGRLSWTRPQGQHLTLKFFGDISRDDIKNISAAMQKRVVAEQKMNLKVEKLGVFPDARRPRALWCGVTGDVENLSISRKNWMAISRLSAFPRKIGLSRHI